MEHQEKIEKRVKKTVKSGIKKGVKILFFIILAIGLALLVALVTMKLWNWLMPELFGLPLVTYWQAAGLLVLAKIIFGFGGGNGPGKKKTSKKRFRSKKCSAMRSDFSDWQHYDAFWKEEGEQAYQDYLQRKTQEKVK